MMNVRMNIILFLVLLLFVTKSLFAETVSVYALEAMPYCGVVDGKPAGIAIDVLNKATQYGAPDFKFNFSIPWIRATQRVQTAGSELVAIIPFTRSAVREEKFKWVTEIMATEYRFYSYGRTAPVKSIDEIKGDIVGVVHGHAIIPMLRQHGIRLDTGAKTAYVNAMKMANHRFNIMADSDVIAVYSWKQTGQNAKALQVGPAIGDIKRVYIAAGLEFPDVVAQRISDAVEKMKHNGELQKIYDKWL